MEKGRRRKNRKKRLVLNVVLASVLLLFLVVAYFGGTMFMEYNSKGKGNGEIVSFEIEQGSGSLDIATKLKEEGLIKYRVVFILKAREMGVLSQLRYGVFDLHKDAGLETLIQELVSGGAKKEEAMFTVPEGYSIEQIAVKLEEDGICAAKAFLQAIEQDYDFEFLETIPEDADVKYKLQGFLFPDTYAIADDMTPQDIVTVMLQQFDTKFTDEMKSKAAQLGKSVFEVVTEASIIERETMVDAERVMVAGVIKNRLEDGMRLQMCPTVLYPLTNGIYDKTSVTNEDTLLDSPYNTYQNKGLPPGPIANPGILSLEAALNPAEHDYLFYHTDTEKNDGSHIFTKTYQEHVDTQ